MHKLDQPEAFNMLDPLEKAALLAWIGYAMRPASRYSDHTSYGMKHAFEHVCFYATNGQFKGAMLAAGYEPEDPTELNWVFKVKPRRRGKAGLEGAPYTVSIAEREVLGRLLTVGVAA